MKEDSKFKFFTLFSLYIAQSVPMTFFSTVLPVIMRQNNFSLTSIGLLQLVKIPWILKFLWAPFVDKYSNRTSSYKKIIFTSEIIYAIFISIIAFLRLEVDITLIVVLLLLAFTASATQDIATDAFAILILKKEQRSIGNSMQSGGSFTGTIIGSGILLMIYAKFGWKFLIFGLAAFVIVALIPLFFDKSEVKKTLVESKKIPLVDIINFFKQKNILKHVLLLFLFYSPLIGILTMSKPWLVDLHYSIKQIGVYFGVYGPSAGFLTSLLAGVIIKKIGRKKSLGIFFGMGIIVTSFFLFLSKTTTNNYLIIASIIMLWMTYGASSVALYTIAMDSVRAGKEGTDFTIQIVLSHLGSLFMAILSGKLAHSFHYSGLFIIELILSVLIFLLFPFLYKFKNLINENR